MRSKLMTAGLALVVLGVSACGSSSSSSSPAASSASSSSSATTSATTKATKKGSKTAAGAVASRTYSLKLAGKAETPPGAPKGIGAAVVTVHGKTLKACWRFSRLHGFTSPTAAHIHSAAAGKAGPIVIPLGAKFKHAGCAPASATLLKAIEKNPHGFYVNIHNKKYPGGAVRSQL